MVDFNYVGADPYYIYADQIDTPRVITDTNNLMVWRWDQTDPFGAMLPDENPTSLGTFTYNLRFPGQVYDAETGKHYNVNRDYDPAGGRYIQSDPIGLSGGQWSTYSYVRGNPLAWRDPLGLRPLTSEEKTSLGPYIPQADLENADVHVGEMPWYAPGWAAGITRGNDIYFRDPQQTFCTPRDVALLGHELVHVGQYRDGMTWLGYLLASKEGYENNPYEVSAYELQRKIQRELRQKDCSCAK